MSRRAAIGVAVVVVLVLAIVGSWPRERGAKTSGQPTVVQSAASADAPAHVATLVVRVVASGQPLAGTAVVVQEDAQHPFPPLASSLTGPDGVARLAVPFGSWHLVVGHPEFARHRRALEVVGERVELEVLLERGVRIEGRVVDAEGAAVADAALRVVAATSHDEYAQQKTDSHGAFAIPGLDVGTYRLYVHTGRHQPRWEGPIRFSEHGEVRRVHIRLEASRTLAGRVVDTDGNPIPEASVGAADEGSLLVTTDAEGRFELGGLGDRPSSVFATAPGYAPTHLRGVRPGGRNLELVLERPASVEGRLDVTGVGVSVMVSVCRHDDWYDKELCVARRLFDPPRSEIVLENLPVGPHELVIEARGYRTVRVPVSLSPGQKVTVEGLRLTPDDASR